MRKDIVYYFSDLNTKYAQHSDGRWPTFKMAMNLLAQFDGKTIVETGCARLKDDWGGGLSTMLLGHLCHMLDNGAHLWTVDLSARNMETCKQLTEDYKDYITYSVGDSVEFLRDLKLDSKIDLLYLDSYDYEYSELLNYYGGKSDIHAAMAKLAAMSESEIVEKHGSLIKGSQEHCVKELEAAMPHCHDRTIILIDDASLPGGGKPRLAKELLDKWGYTCLYEWSQTLWIKTINI